MSADDAQDPRLGTTLGGVYLLESRLGAGGMGVVYRARHGDTLVAVKRLHDSFAGSTDWVKRFSREVAVMRRLRHPNLVAILDSGVEGGVPFLVMEHLVGTSLGDRVRNGRIEPAEALALMQQVLAGLQLAHAQGVVHRDLKPDNVFLVTDGTEMRVKVLDFGVAKLVDTGDTKLTSTGLAIGTPSYMAPEQALGTGTDARADIYAAGIMLFEMLAGRRPFIADSPIAIVRMQLDETPPSLREARPVSEALEAAVLRAMAKTPEERWPDAESFARALAATPEGGGKAARRRWRPGPWTFRFAALALVATSGVYAWSKMSSRDHKQVRRTFDETVDKTKTTLGEVNHVVDKARSTVSEVARSLDQPAGAPIADQRTPVDKKAPATDDDADDDADTGPVEAEPAEPRPIAAKPPAPNRPVRLADAVRLVNAGKLDDGIALLRELRRRGQNGALVALWLGHAYFHKNWRTDGLREYAIALKARPSLRRDPQLGRNLIIALENPTYRAARVILVGQIGASALPSLRRAAQKADNPKVRERAARLSVELSKRRTRR